MGQEGSEQRWLAPAHWPAYAQDDEISLLDLWLVLRRRWKTLAFVVCLCVAAGLAYALLSSARYRYYETIQIGHVPRQSNQGIKDEPIASVENVIAHIDSGLIPQALDRTFPRENDEAAALRKRYDVKATAAGSSSFVVISGEGPLQQRDGYFAVLKAVAEMLVSDHAAVSDATRETYQSRLEKARIKLDALNNDDLFQVKLAEQRRSIEAARNRLAQLEDQDASLKLQSQRLGVKADLLTAQIERVQENIAAATDAQNNAAREARSATDAMTVLLLSNDVRHSRERLADLHTQLKVVVPNELTGLEAARKDNQRQQAQQRSLITLRTRQLQQLRIDHRNAQATQEQTVRGLESQLARVRPTRVVLSPTRSMSPVGLARRMVLALSLVLGLMLGVLAVFVHEFLVRARHYENEKEWDGDGPLATRETAGSPPRAEQPVPQELTVAASD